MQIPKFRKKSGVQLQVSDEASVLGEAEEWAEVPEC